MARVGDVWDSTTAVLAGRARLIAPIVAAGVFLPNVVGRAIKIFGGASPGMAAVAGLVTLAALLLNLWAGLAVVAIASDPATTREEAGRLAVRRLPKALLIVVVAIGLVLLLCVPPVAVLAAGGFDWQALAAAQDGAGRMPDLSPGAAAFVTLWVMAALPLLLWVSARLFLVNPVVLEEDRGLGALGRSWALTRGWTLRLIGVALLFGLVLIVSTLAVNAIVFIPLRLIVGPDGIGGALFAAAVASAAVQAAFVAVVQVFAARLYAAVVPAPARPVGENIKPGPWG